MVRARLVWLLSLILTLLVLWGCGGGSGGGSPPSPKNGKVTVSLTWPASTRALPSYAKSVILTVADASNPSVAQQVTVNQPATVPQTVSVDIPGPWVAGSYVLTAKAYDQANGYGQLVARSQKSFSLAAGGTFSLDVSGELKSEVSQIVISGDPISIVSGNTQTLVATAYGPTNLALMLPPGQIKFSVTAGADHGSITSAGVFTATSVGSVTVQAADAESGVSGTATVNVQPVTTGPNTVTAVISWPAAERVLPSYAQSVSILVTNTATPGTGNEIIVNQPATTPGNVPVTVPGPWPDGTYTVVAKAFDQRNGQGQLVASLRSNFTLANGQAYSIDISASLQSEVSKLVIFGQPLSVTTGSTLQMSASAYNASGQLLLLPTGWITWSATAGSASGAITKDGLFTSTSTTGTTTIQAQEKDSGLVATADVAVTSTTNTGSTVTAVVNWTAGPNAGIPSYADSFQIFYSPQGIPLTKKIARPASLPSQSVVTLDGTYVPGGIYTLNVKAFIGTGPVSNGTYTFTATAGETKIDVGALAKSLVDHVGIGNVPSNTMLTGATVQLTATSFQLGNAVVPVPNSAYVWSVSAGSASGSISSSGLFTAGSTGTATVTLLEPNSQKSITADIKVASASGGNTGLDPASPWPTSEGNNARTNRGVAAFHLTPYTRVWKTDLAGGATPTTLLSLGSNGVGYGFATDKQLYAIDMASGAVLWKFDPGIQFAPTIAPSIGSDNALYWTQEDPSDDRLSNIVAFDLVTRTIRWKTTGFRAGGVAVANGCVISSTSLGIMAFDTLTGAQRWLKGPANCTGTVPAVFGNTVCAYYAVDIPTGTLKWVPGVSTTYTMATPQGAFLVNGAKAFDAATGKLVWQGTGPWPCLAGAASDRIVTSPSIRGNIGDGGLGLYCYDASVGALLWNEPTYQYSQPISDVNGLVLVYNLSKNVNVVFDSSNGAILGTLPSLPYGSLSMGADGTIYKSTGTGWAAYR